ncbi:MAG: bifunctional diaminohydroxyphosphoribosylaminopyrimidine deaminase/5-amino-6-(5-phosphoribosylamino)uracil reductase RibD [Bacteroidia bacterium]|nr:bifunctional diaminohydroxyphosphoribosylaminopyrimidine deaminase/5-amino-6-(5-phosphoribosylamino)uracil reductase RibD [Bacteroidia bacterium]
MTAQDLLWLFRALELARRGSPVQVEPNPPVGAVIAVGEQLLGEGYHRAFGGPHAEIEALRQVRETKLLEKATLYVTLEPCCHTDKKTPPCVPEIVGAGIRRVVVGCEDPNPAVSGRGIEALRAAGVEVLIVPDSRPFQALLKHFRVSITKQRPYITLKWAQTSRSGALYESGYIGSRTQGRWPISGFWGKVWGHRLRAAHSHIAVGYRTWILDQPLLTTRYFPGENPKVLIFYEPQHGMPKEKDERFFPLTTPFEEMLKRLYLEHGVGSLLVEGGAALLQRFIASGLYDEIHVLMRITREVPPAPVLAPVMPVIRWRRRRLSPDEIVWVGHP